MSRPILGVAGGVIVAWLIWVVRAEREEHSVAPPGLESQAEVRFAFAAETAPPIRRPVGVDFAGTQDKPAWTLEIVSAASGRAVPGAYCDLLLDSKWTRAVTDGSGCAQLLIPARATTLRVSCAGFVGAEVAVDPTNLLARIALDPAGRAIGRVEDHLGQAAPPDVWILATGIERGPMRLDDFNGVGTFSEGAEVVVARTDAAGRFELDRLRPGAVYRVRAVGQGIATNAHRNVTAGGPEVVLVGGRICAAEVRFREASGERPRTSAPLSGARQFSFEFVQPGRAELAWLTDELTRLAGFPAAALDRPVQDRSTMIVAWVPFSEDFALARYRWSAPGYQETRGEVRLLGVNQGIPLHEVVVRRELGAGWGDLLIRLEQVPDEASAPTQATPPVHARLLLTRFDPSTEQPVDQFRMRIDPRGRKGELLRNVPAGLYRASLHLPSAARRIESREFGQQAFALQPEGELSLTFLINDLLAAELVLSDASLRVYEGPFRGRLAFRQDGELRSEFEFDFEGPPYRLVGLAEGEYSFIPPFRGVHPPPVGTFAESPTFRVTRGEVAHVDYQIADGVLD